MNNTPLCSMLPVDLYLDTYGFLSQYYLLIYN